MNIPSGFCQCGCGTRTGIITKNIPRFGWVKGEHKRYIHGHNPQAPRARRLGADNRQWKGGRIRKNGYVMVHCTDHPRFTGNYVYEHILIAEEAIGTLLPAGAQVHHVNGVKDDNRRQNLVICQDLAFHKLLHQRQSALDACGHADWLKCLYCAEYDDTANMTVNQRRSSAYHRKCRAAAAMRLYYTHKAERVGAKRGGH